MNYISDTIVITNRHLVQGDYLEQIQKVVSLHPYALILREKDLAQEEYAALAEEILTICRKGQVPCYIHSEVALAKHLQSPYVHMSVQRLEEYSPEELGFLQGLSVSCHSLEDVQLALRRGATQIVLGTIFETDCKKGLKGKGVSFVQEICEYTKQNGNIPVFAIGGISPERIESVKAAGARGGCMMSYMMRI